MFILQHFKELCCLKKYRSVKYVSVCGTFYQKTLTGGDPASTGQIRSVLDRSFYTIR